MDRLEDRLARLEQANRRLSVLWLLTIAGLFAFGFQTTNDVLRARRIEVVNAKGVPLAILGPSRGDAGGELVLRDREGERRANLSVETGGASLRLQGGKVDDPTGTAALHAESTGAALGLFGSRAFATITVRKERPRIATIDAQGRETFGAPWR